MALASTVVWEVRTTGNDNNGGGFNTASSGTDYSQQDTPVLTVTDGTTSAAGSTTLTSATGGFTAQMVGNVCHIYGGTNTVEGWYEITGFTDSNTVTLDRAPDNGSGGISGATVVVGGALASPGGLGKALQDASPGNTVWIKGGPYSITSSSVNVPGGLLELPQYVALYVAGYGVTRGDGQKATIVYNGPSVTGQVIKAYGDRTGPGEHVLRWLDVDCNNLISYAFYLDGAQRRCYAIECNAKNATSCGFFSSTRGATLIQCVAESTAGSGIQIYGVAIACVVKNCGDPGIYLRGDHSLALRCIAYGCSYIGIAPRDGERSKAIGCVAYGNGTHGFHVAGYDQYVEGCISVNNGGYGFHTNGHQGTVLYKCASYNNTSGRLSDPDLFDIDPVILSGDPFVDGPNGDFRLNDAAGAVLKDAGIHIPGQQDKTDLNAFDGTLEGSGAPVVIPGPSRTKWWV